MTSKKSLSVEFMFCFFLFFSWQPQLQSVSLADTAGGRQNGSHLMKPMKMKPRPLSLTSSVCVVGETEAIRSDHQLPGMVLF